MVNVLVNSQGKVYTINGQAIAENNTVLLTVNVSCWGDAGMYGNDTWSTFIINGVSYSKSQFDFNGQDGAVGGVYTKIIEIESGVDLAWSIDNASPGSGTINTSENYTLEINGQNGGYEEPIGPIIGPD